jgi:S-formylglutathione hydrolase
MDAIPRSALLTATLAALSLPTIGGSQEWKGGVIRTVDVPAPSLKGNLLGDSASRTTSIYLPPSYRFSRFHRYPVIYLLHGFAADNRAFISGNYQGLSIRVAMDSLIARGTIQEMIVVTPNARNRYDGAFYANSPVTGNWEDFIVRDLIRYVDSHFRTIAARSGRAVAGHSMGGNGALRLGMRYPELFSVVYAMSPYGLSLDTAPPKWIATAWMKALSLTDSSQFRKAGFAVDLLISESAVYSPDTARRPFFVDFPFRTEQGRLVIDSAIAKKWRLPLSEVRQHSTNLRRERIGFDSGRGDAFVAIPRDVTLLDRTLTELGIPHFAELYDGGHADKIRQRLEQVALPFISASFEDAQRRGKARLKR